MQTTEHPLLLTVKEAARELAITPWSMYQLLDKQVIQSVYQGRRRYVISQSLREYVAALPASPEVESA